MVILHKKIEEEYRENASFEVLSGRMIPVEFARPVSSVAGYISQAYQQVEEMTCIKFGEDYLWHIFNPDKSDWYQHKKKISYRLMYSQRNIPTETSCLCSRPSVCLTFGGKGSDR